MIGDRRRGAAIAIVWIVACVPISVSAIPPFLDYPAHLGRVHLLAGLCDGCEEYFQPAWALLPNLALDLVAVPLARFVSAELAMRLFTALTLGLLVLGGARLHRAAGGRTALMGLAPALLLYNHVLAFGFLNFLFGLGLALLALALHIERKDERPGARLLRECAAVLALYFSHLMALSMYALAAAAHDAATRIPSRSWRSLARDGAFLAAALVPPLILLFAGPTGPEMTSPVFHFHAKLDKLATVLDTGQGGWDRAFALALFALVALAFALRLVRFDRKMAVVTVVFATVFALAPYRFVTIENIDTRLPIVCLALGFAGLDLRVDGRGRAIAAALAALFLLRMGTTTLHHVRSGQELDRIRADLRSVPAGSLLFTVSPTGGAMFRADDWDPPLVHATALLLLERPVFVQTLFTHASQQPIARRPPFHDVRPARYVKPGELHAAAAIIVSSLHEVSRSDPAYLFYIKGEDAAVPGPHLSPVIDRPRYTLYRLAR